MVANSMKTLYILHEQDRFCQMGHLCVATVSRSGFSLGFRTPRVEHMERGDFTISVAEKRIENQAVNFDVFVKSRISVFFVIPAEAGIQEYQGLLDPGFRRGDGLGDFLRVHQF